MKFYVILVGGLLALASCGGSKVIYAKYGRMKLAENEVNSQPVSGADIGIFEKCCYTETDQVFLNRAVTNTAGNYHIFISVSETIMQSEFPAIQAADKSIELLDNKSELISSIRVNGYLLKKDGQFVARFTYHETKSGILVIYDFASPDENKARDIYTNMSSYLDEKIRL